MLPVPLIVHVIPDLHGLNISRRKTEREKVKVKKKTVVFWFFLDVTNTLEA